MTRTPIVIALFCLAAWPHEAQAAFIISPVQWQTSAGGNGHYYGLYQSDGVTWTEARSGAEALIYLGSTGHVATITSQAESDFLQSHFAAYIGDPNAPGGLFPAVSGIRAWIGLNDAVSEGTFQWITGEPFSFSEWAGPEPNNLGDEDYVYVWRRDFGTGPLWSWNDSGNRSDVAGGYFVEFDGPIVAPVPEPSTSVTFILGSAFFALRRLPNRWRRIDRSTTAR